jgi:outer membrane lipoprotein-sorting protein
MKVNKTTRKQILLSILLNQEAISKSFKTLSNTQSEGIIQVTLEPKNSDLNIQKLFIKLDSKSKQIREISYSDDIGNLTSIDIRKTKFENASEKKIFKFQLPSGATVTNL